MICKLSLLILSHRTVNTVTRSYDTLAVLPKILWLKTDRILEIIFKSVKFFISSSCAKFHVQNCPVNSPYHLSAQTTLNIRLRPNPRYLPSCVSSDNPTFVPTRILLCIVTDNKVTVRTGIILIMEDVSQHQTSCMLLCVIYL